MGGRGESHLVDGRADVYSLNESARKAAAAGELLEKLRKKAHPNPTFAVTSGGFTRRGVTTDTGEFLKLRTRSTGGSVKSIAHADRYIALSPNRKLAAVSGRRGVALVDSRSGRLQQLGKPLIGLGGPLAFSRDARLLAPRKVRRSESGT